MKRFLAFLPKLIIAGFLGLVFVVMLTKLPEMTGYLPASSELFVAEREKVTRERLLLQREQIALERKRIRIEWREIEQKEAYLPTQLRNKELRAYILTGALVGLVFGLPLALVLTLWFRPQETAAILLAWRRHNTPDLNRDMVRLAIAELGYNRELVKLQKALPPEERKLIDVTPYSNTERRPCPDALECLNEGAFPKKKGFLVGFEGTTPVYEHLPEKKTGMALIGSQGQGKSTWLAGLIAQARLWGDLVLIFDLAHPDSESLVSLCGPLAHDSGVQYFDDRETALNALYFMEQFLDARGSKQIPKDPRCFVFVDELLNFMACFQDDKPIQDHVIKVFNRLTTEGRRNLIYLIASSHSWKVSEMGTSTFRNQLRYQVSFAADKRDLQTLSADSELARMNEGLDVGEMVYKAPTGKRRKLMTPHWTPEAIDKAASMVTPAAWPEMSTPTQKELDTYRGKVVDFATYCHRDDAELIEQLRPYTLPYGGLKQTAEALDISERGLAKMLDGGTLQRTTRQKIIQFLHVAPRKLGGVTPPNNKLECQQA